MSTGAAAAVAAAAAKLVVRARSRWHSSIGCIVVATRLVTLLLFLLMKQHNKWGKTRAASLSHAAQSSTVPYTPGPLRPLLCTLLCACAQLLCQGLSPCVAWLLHTPHYFSEAPEQASPHTPDTAVQERRLTPSKARTHLYSAGCTYGLTGTGSGTSCASNEAAWPIPRSCFVRCLMVLLFPAWTTARPHSTMNQRYILHRTIPEPPSLPTLLLGNTQNFWQVECVCSRAR